MRESEIQAQIIKHHKSAGWLVIKLIQTTINGIPDLLLIKDSRVVFLEVKAQYKTSTPLQRYVQKLLSDQGVDVFETSNPDFFL